MALCLGACTSGPGPLQSQSVVHSAPGRRTLETSAQLQRSIEQTLIESRRAVDQFGVTETTVDTICKALGQLAKQAGLKEEYRLRQLHGGGATSVILASEGDEGMTLRLSKFEPDKPTPIHDHGCWAIAYVMEGHDDYIHWERTDDGSDPGRANLRIKHKKTLQPGDCVHWTDPPGDIHSQRAVGGEAAWELVLFGKNHGRTPRQYFDPDSGKVTRRLPQ